MLADTGFLLALNQPRDSLYQRAAAWAQSIAEPIVVTEYVLWEMFNGLSRPNHRESAHDTLQYIEDTAHWEIISASRDWFRDGLELHRRRNDKAWSLTDCISFLVMDSRKIVRALTSDHHFEQAGYEALLRRDPD
ncbi:MAG: type II toxin-antitoxin system VapC family toxin [Planctomycetaceae bacterium]